MLFLIKLITKIIVVCFVLNTDAPKYPELQSNGNDYNDEQFFDIGLLWPAR